jgi:hypothetical protein
MKFDVVQFHMRRTLAVLGVLSAILLFTSISSTEPSAVLLAQISTDQLTGNRTQVHVDNCFRSDFYEIQAINVESDITGFVVREVGIHDAFGTSEHFYFDKNENGTWTELESEKCISSLEISGYPIGQKKSARKIIRVWGLRH